MTSSNSKNIWHKIKSDIKKKKKIMQNEHRCIATLTAKVNYLSFMQLIAAKGDNGFKVPSLVKLAAPLVHWSGSGYIRKGLAWHILKQQLVSCTCDSLLTPWKRLHTLKAFIASCYSPLHRFPDPAISVWSEKSYDFEQNKNNRVLFFFI